MSNDYAIKDSGERTKFASGAVRDCAEGKGRMDLMPMDIVLDLMTIVSDDSRLLMLLEELKDINFWYNSYKKGEICNLNDVVKQLQLSSCSFINEFVNSIYVCEKSYCVTIDSKKADLFLNVSKHFEKGALKYGENNWQKGIPIESYWDSFNRHLFKCIRCDCDERHDLAAIWNLICMLWTIKQEFENNYLIEKVE